MRTQYFSLLGVATVAILALTVWAYRRTRDCGVWVGAVALYYWSLFGAWSVVIDKTGGTSGKNYYYLESKMFPVSLDRNYLGALILYALFVAGVLLTLVLFTPPAVSRARTELALRHGPILVIGAAAALASYLLVRSKLAAAWEQNTSAYWYTRSDTGPWFTLHQVLNRVALLPPAIGLASLASHPVGRRQSQALFGYGALLLAMSAFAFLLGNKNEVLVALLTGLFAYAGLCARPAWWKLAFVGLSGFWFLYAIDFFRAVPLSSLGKTVTERAAQATELLRFAGSSNEAFAAHFSLYGILAAHVPQKPGYSFYSLACSLVPRVVWPERPQDIYFYYSESVGTVQNQGYSLHHVAGWYLNFGIAGVLLGALVMGGLWSYCLSARLRTTPRSGRLWRTFASVAPWLFAAYLPPLIRAGPEGYKGWFVEAVAIPTLVLAAASAPMRKATPCKHLIHRQQPTTYRPDTARPVRSHL